MTGSSSGIDCGGDCSETVEADSSLTLTAQPEVGYAFAGWSGDAVGSTNPLKLNNISGNMTVHAAFQPVRKGDINSDGVLDPADVIIGLRMIAGCSPEFIDENNILYFSDVDDDNSVGIPEILYMLQSISSVISQDGK